jgi:hypothetical protein
MAKAMRWTMWAFMWAFFVLVIVGQWILGVTGGG